MARFHRLAPRIVVALPVDDILGNAASLLDRWIGHEPEMADKLRQILASANLDSKAR